MRVSCSKSSLAEGINIVQKAVSTKTTLQILEGILLEVGEKFKLTGNDLEIGIECYVDATISERGSVVINSKMFGEIVRRLPEAEVFIEVKENNQVIIECENSHFEIKGMSAQGYPAIPSIEGDNSFKINQNILKDMIKQTIFAVSIDENRPILTGSLLEYKNGEFSIISIDGFRLALRRTTSIHSDSSNLCVVVPGKTLNEIVKILQPIDDDVLIFSTNNQILFDLGNCKIVSRLLEGEYMNYRSIIPDDSATMTTVNTKELLSSIERASLVITAEDRRYPVRFNIANDELIVTSNTEVGTVREQVKVNMEGENLDIRFNPKYFIDALRAIEDEAANIFYTNTIGPCTIRPINGNKYAYMVLPVRK